MADHRIRLDDVELALIIAALRSREAGVSLRTRSLVRELRERLEECTPGNPNWIFGQVSANSSRTSITVPGVKSQAKDVES